MATHAHRRQRPPAEHQTPVDTGPGGSADPVCRGRRRLGRHRRFGIGAGGACTDGGPADPAYTRFGSGGVDRGTRSNMPRTWLSRSCARRRHRSHDRPRRRRFDQPREPRDPLPSPSPSQTRGRLAGDPARTGNARLDLTRRARVFAQAGPAVAPRNSMPLDHAEEIQSRRAATRAMARISSCLGTGDQTDQDSRSAGHGAATSLTVMGLTIRASFPSHEDPHASPAFCRDRPDVVPEVVVPLRAGLA